MLKFKSVLIIGIGTLLTLKSLASDLPQGMFDYSPNKACGITSESRLREMVRKDLCGIWRRSKQVTDREKQEVIRDVIAKGCPVTDQGRQIGDLAHSMSTTKYNFDLLCNL